MNTNKKYNDISTSGRFAQAHAIGAYLIGVIEQCGSREAQLTVWEGKNALVLVAQDTGAYF